MAANPAKIVVEGVYKIFGRDAEAALDMTRSDEAKSAILEKTGCVVALNDINLEIGAGETFVIMGLSGSGKSTLIRHFNRLVEPTAGRILVNGRNVLEMTSRELIQFRRSGISMVFQRFGLLPHQSVLENVMCGLSLTGVPRKRAIRQAMEQIEIVGLSGFENKYPRQLSGGMQQRVGLARALATEADILLMDEAFSALDPLIKADMQAQLKSIQQQVKKTIVFITHDLDEGLHLGDRLAILKDGEIRQIGTGEEIVFSPADDYVRRFVQKVDYARALSVRSIFRRAPVNGQPAPIEPCAHRGDQGASNGVAPTEPVSIDVDAALGASFSLLSRHKSLVVTDGGVPVGTLDRHAAFSAMARSVQ